MRIGEFSIELINAETKEPMKEFIAPDGKVYVEAEPDLEYFIRCHRERGVKYYFSKNKNTAVALEVDGSSLGYNQPFDSKTTDLGLWKRQNGVNTMRALKLILKKRSRGADSSLSSTTPPIGSVKATFYEIFYFDDMVPLVDCDKANCLNQSSTPAPAVASGAKKAFVSVSGSATNTPICTKFRKRRELGTCLGEMTIHYTSALGLSQLGILAPIVPAATQNYEDVSVVTEPKRKRVKTEPGLRCVVSPSCPRSNNSLIDLTGDD